MRAALSLLVFVLFSIYLCSADTVTSIPAQNWKAFFGVNAHIYNIQTGQSGVVKDMAIYLGVGSLRDDTPWGGNAAVVYQATLPDFIAMYQAGIRLNALASFWNLQTPSSHNSIAEQVQGWESFQQQTGGMIESIEGFNEINMSPFPYNGVDPGQSFSGMIQAIYDLYSAVKGSSILGNLPVYDATDVCASSPQASGCNSLTSGGSRRANYANIHPYPNYGAQSIGLDGGDNVNTQFMNYEYSGMNDPSQFVITETGYHTDSYTNGYTTSVSELAHGKLTVNCLLNAMSMGFHKSFIYEIWDQADYAGSIEGHFGLFRADRSPKPAGKALHFFSQLLADSGAVTSQLTFTLTNFPQYGKYMLFQNSAGVYFLVFWINLQVWNNGDVYNPPQTVTLNLPWATNANVYDIYSSQSDSVPLAPISTQYSSAISFNFADTAVVVSFAAGSGTVAAATTGVPPPVTTGSGSTTGSSPPSSGAYTLFTDNVNTNNWVFSNRDTSISVSSYIPFSGSASLYFATPATKYGNAIFTYNAGTLSLAGITHLRFAARIDQGQASASLGVQASGSAWTSSLPLVDCGWYGPDPLTDNVGWTVYNIPISAFGLDQSTGVQFVLFIDQTGLDRAYYIDQIQFVSITNVVSVYDDGFADGWAWRNARSTASVEYSLVYSGGNAFTFSSQNYGNLEFYRSSALDTTGFTHLQFVARSYDYTQSRLIIQSSDVAWTDNTPNIYVAPAYGPTPVSWAWTTYQIPLSDLGASQGALFILFLDNFGSGSTYYIDQVEFIHLQ